MSVKLQLFAASLGVGLFTSVGFVVYSLRNLDRRGAKPLIVILSGAIVWILARIFQILTPEEPAATGAVLFRLLGPEIIIVGFVLFALEFTGRTQFVTRWTAGGLFLKPALTAVIALTPLRTQLLEFGSPEQMANGFEITATPFFTAHLLYNYVLALVGVALLTHMLFRAGYSYQRQVVGLLFAFSPPIIGNALYNIVGVFPFDPTPLLFSVTTVLLMYAVFKLQFLDATPIAQRTIFDEMDEMVFVVDADGLVSTVNRATVEMFGASETLQGQQIQEILDADIAVQQEPATENYDITTTIDDETHHFTVTQSGLTDYRDEAIGQLIVCRDITERIERERQLKRQNERLEQFASVVSHDLRNPLQTARGFTDIAMETGDHEHLERVQDSHERMNTMIEELLTLTRTGGEVEDEKRQAVQLQSLTAETWETAETGDATLETAIPDQWEVDADPGLVRNVLENLFRNTADHNDPPLTVRVGTFERPGSEGDDNAGKAGDGGVVSDHRGFYIEDDGSGIHEQDRDEVFDHGYTTDSDGTGFGLSIVRDVVEAHGWTVTVTESDDGGARFEIVTHQ